MRVALIPGIQPQAGAATRIRRGQVIHGAGVPGGAWEILAGCVRLDLDLDDDSQSGWAGLATAGDIIGVEALRDGCTSYRATALTSCSLRAWRPEPGVAGQRRLLETLIQSQSRMAGMLNLRIGRAPQRVHRLLTMLGAMPLELPALQDMADMTGLSIETVSRTLTQLEESGLVFWQGRQRNKRLVDIAPSLPSLWNTCQES